MSKTRLILAFAAVLSVAAAQSSDAPGVSVDLSGAALLHRTPVSYPEAARLKGVKGSVTLELTLDATGNVNDARVLSGPDELRKTALQSVLQWHFAHGAPGTNRQVTIAFDPPAATANSPVPGSRQEELARAALQRRLPALGVGRTVKSVQILGLSDSLRADLLTKLPIREGDVISNESWERAARVVREFDEHMSLSMLPGATERERPGGDMILQIMAPSGQVTTTPPGAIRVGGSIQQTRLVKQERPVYPAEAKQARLQGVVKLQAAIGRDGTVQQLDLISGHPTLAPAAMAAVKQWVYQPTLLNGNPVEVVTQVDINFTLSQ